MIRCGICEERANDQRRGSHVFMLFDFILFESSFGEGSTWFYHNYIYKSFIKETTLIFLHETC